MATKQELIKQQLHLLNDEIADQYELHRLSKNDKLAQEIIVNKIRILEHRRNLLNGE